MIGLTFARYLFRRHATTTLWFMAGVGALTFIIDFTEFSRQTAALPSYRATTALMLSAMRLPYILQQIVPFVGFFATLATLIALNRKHELVVARSSGVSAWQFLLPIGVSAFLFGLASAVLLNPLGAAGIQYASSVEALWKTGASNVTTASDMPWLRQKVGADVTVIGAHAVLNGGTELRDATFYRIGADGRIVERVDAAKAVLIDGFWALETITRRAANGDITRQDGMKIATTLDPVAVSEKIARPDMIAIHDLVAKIKAAKAFGYPVRALSTQLQSLVALPMLMVSMALIAATVSLRFVRLGQSVMLIFGGIAAGFLLYVVAVLAKAFGSAGVVAPVAAAWFPVVTAMFFGVTYLLHREDG